MGEYAKFQGHDVKLGTCEDMYYLRADQRHMVHGREGGALTATENRAYTLQAVELGRELRDEAAGAFSDAIRRAHLAGWSLREIAPAAGLHWTSVGRICRESDAEPHVPPAVSEEGER